MAKTRQQSLPPETKQPYLKIALQCIASLVLNKYTSCMPMDCVSVAVSQIPVANIFGI